MNVRRCAWKIGKLGLVTGLGVVAAIYAPVEAYEKATSVLATFAGVVVAALVPTMILAATILRPVSRGKIEFTHVRAAVARQISFFSGIFLLTILLTALLFLTSLTGWKDVVLPVDLHTLGAERLIDLNITRVLGGIIVSLSALIAIQTTGFVHAIRNLFDLHADNAEKELDRQIEEEGRAILSASLPRDPRTGIGEVIGELTH